LLKSAIIFLNDYLFYNILLKKTVEFLTS